MKRVIAILLGFSMLTVNVAAYEIPGKITEQADNETVTFIVEVEGEPSLVRQKTEGISDIDVITEDILREQQRVMNSIENDVTVNTDNMFVYTSLFNGFSIEGQKKDEERLRNTDGVKNVYISQKTPVAKPLLHNSGEITQIDTAYDSGYSGKGQVIAVIDSFCDTGHEFFAAAPENPKYNKSDIDNILKTKPLNSGTVSANQVYKNEKIPYAYDYAFLSSDTYSHTHYHGTHVTGIAAGKNGKLPNGDIFSGVAYDSQVMFMSASDGNYLYDYMIFAAINDAALLGADVINMSFGSDYQDAALADAYNEIIANAVESGISISAAGGNSSRGYENMVPLTVNTDYSTGGTPASLSAITAVASADNVKSEDYSWIMSLNGEKEIEFYPAYSFSDFDKLVTTEYKEYEYCGLGKSDDFKNVDLSGKIALVLRGEITFVEKANNAKNAGAIGIIIINTENDYFALDELSLPVALVTLDNGLQLYQASDKKIKFLRTEITETEIETAGQLSSYSSWGVDSSLELKPEITAPGGSIYSSYPDNKYTYLSGTSMASPYIAGVFALAREYYESNPYAAPYNGLEGAELVSLIENVMMNSADIIRSDNGLPYSPRIQGAGMVNVENMFNSKVMLTGNSGKAKLSLGEIEDEFEIPFTITNISDDSVVFDDISLELITDGYFEYDGKNYVGNSIGVETDVVNLPNSVTVANGTSGKFTANVKMNSEFLAKHKEIFENGFFVDGFVVLRDSTNNYTVSIPFTGFYGDWYTLPVFDSTTYDEGGSLLADADAPYRTGTLLKAYIDDSSFYYVGRNAVNRATADKKYISFSNKSDLTLALSAITYRTTSDMIFTITDENGETVYSDEYDYLLNKFRSWTYAFDDAKMADLTEGSYTLRAEAIVNGNNEINDTLELPLVIDNTAPRIISAVYNSDTETITVTAEDNHYISYFCLYSDSEDAEVYREVSDGDIKDGKTVMTIDVSGFENPEDITVVACDYAMNYTFKTMKVLNDKFGVELEKLVCFDGLTSAKLSVENNTGEEIAADVIVAFYDENSEMIAVAVKKNTTLVTGETNYLNYSLIADTENAAKVKAFVWENGKMTPMDSVKDFDITTME